MAINGIFKLGARKKMVHGKKLDIIYQKEVFSGY